MRVKTLVLLSAAIILIVSGIALHSMDRPIPLKTPPLFSIYYLPSGRTTVVQVVNSNTSNFTPYTVANNTFNFVPLTNSVEVMMPSNTSYFVANPPLYAQLWFLPLAAGLAILAILAAKRSKL
ncbi:hypothetical protein GWK48_06060 [Metallosphaera tengchongensis]|uniref:Uncharacterized protein n=1 Tax=Metallosphaera tengchongensis TaxID=1532350 RepID=A0A6N0NY20_9CREN|nr:hypothetical protein [Metallosphaera tengchongensis]QKQ99999.1 hypothetical protein GWK48_06060 [Metallosphaera tengchongensis]